MAKFIIEGGRPLNGTVRPSGNKNEALPVLMACLLTEQPVTIRRIPRIGDVVTVCKILESLGVEVSWTADDVVCLNAKNITSHRPEPLLCSKVRASLLLLGPILARLGKIELPRPGGDLIGARRIDTHWEGAVALGATLQFANEAIQGEVKKLKGTAIYLDEPSVTATENLLLMAALAEGRTVLHNAASEPHVTGLARMLKAMGAKIEGLGTNQITIDGVAKLSGVDHTLGEDFMEVGSFLCLGAAARSKIKVEGVNPDNYRFILKTFNRIGMHVKADKTSFEVDGSNIMEVRKDISGRVPTIYSGPWPAFPTDLMSVCIVAATQSQGTTIFFEKMFEGRMFFTDKLMSMAATIILCDPHRVVVNGPSPLYAAKMSSPDVRAGMALLMASLIAKGRSEIDNIVQIERGYYQIEKKLESLGAAIKRLDA